MWVSSLKEKSEVDTQWVSFDPVMPLLETQISEILILVQNDVHLRRLTVALFAQAKTWKQQEGPPIKNWLNLL